MAKPQKQEPCPRCNAEVEIYAADGGGRGSMTIYGARCKCGLDEYGFSNDGTRRSAISTWNRWAREEKAKRAAPGVTPCDEAQRLTALLERLREKCAEEAENHRDAMSDSIARSIRAIELDVAVRQFVQESQRNAGVALPSKDRQ